MARWMQGVVIALVAVASGRALAAGDSGDTGGGDTGGRDAAYDAGVKAIEHQDWAGAIRQFKTSIARDRF